MSFPFRVKDVLFNTILYASNKSLIRIANIISTEGRNELIDQIKEIKGWISGADYVISDYTNVEEKVKDITQGRMADVVLNSLGAETWDNSLACVGINGRWVTFGGLTGADVKLNVRSLYTRQIKLIGSTGGTRKEMHELINNCEQLKVRVRKRFRLESIKEALQSLFAKNRNGRILLDVT